MAELFGWNRARSGLCLFPAIYVFAEYWRHERAATAEATAAGMQDS